MQEGDGRSNWISVPFLLGEPIAELIIGDIVLAYNEETGEVGDYPIVATFEHLDPEIVLLTIDGELIETTPEHPFYVIEPTPLVLDVGEAWQALSQTAGRWVDAGELAVGNHVWRADGSTGAVESVDVVAVEQRMYNLTVDVAHTFFVGGGAWLVHNCGGGFLNPKSLQMSHGLSGDSSTKRIIKLADEMRANGSANIDPIKIIMNNGQNIIVDGHHRVKAASLAGIDIPYEIVDESWLMSNTSWRSMGELIQDAMQPQSVNLNRRKLNKAGYK